MTLDVRASLYEDDLDLVPERLDGTISAAAACLHACWRLDRTSRITSERRAVSGPARARGAPSRIRTCDTRFRNLARATLHGLATTSRVNECPGREVLCQRWYVRALRV